jgi:hypothetical protein
VYSGTAKQIAKKSGARLCLKDQPQHARKQVRMELIKSHRIPHALRLGFATAALRW